MNTAIITKAEAEILDVDELVKIGDEEPAAAD